MKLGAHSIGLFQPLPEVPEEAPCARPSSNFYSSATIVERANSTDSAAHWKSTPLFQPLSAPVLVEVERGVCLPDSSGRGWKSPIERALDLQQTRSLNETLQKEADNSLHSQLQKENTCVQELWQQNCNQLREFDATLAQKEDELEQMKDWV